MTVRLAPMTSEQFDALWPGLIEGYAADMVAAAALPADAARERAERQAAELLPDGVATPEHHLLVAYDDDRPVGRLWLWIHDDSVGRRAFIYDVEVDPAMRGRGYGRSIMLAAEAYAQERGVRRMALNVFGGNRAARSLYDRLGYMVTSTAMHKDLGRPIPPS